MSELKAEFQKDRPRDCQRKEPEKGESVNSEIREVDKRKDVGIDGKGSTLLPEKKGSCLQLAPGEGAGRGLGQLSRKEERVTGTKALAAQ